MPVKQFINDSRVIFISSALYSLRCSIKLGQIKKGCCGLNRVIQVRLFINVQPDNAADHGILKLGNFT